MVSKVPLEKINELAATMAARPLKDQLQILLRYAHLAIIAGDIDFALDCVHVAAAVRDRILANR